MSDHAAMGLTVPVYDSKNPGNPIVYRSTMLAAMMMGYNMDTAVGMQNAGMFEECGSQNGIPWDPSGILWVRITGHLLWSHDSLNLV